MNTPIKLVKGSITMCGIDDFKETLKDEHTVVTLCRYPPKGIDLSNHETHHYYFTAYGTNYKVWIHAVNLVMELLDEGKDVLIHCIHGRDRTGGVVYCVLRLLGDTHDVAYYTMCNARPSQIDEWSVRIPNRLEEYEKIIKGYENMKRELKE